MVRPKTSSLRKGVWFTAGLAAFVVVCLIAAYAGETVHTSPVSLPQQTPVVRGGHVSGDKVTQARRSAMASVEEVASAFKSAEPSEDATQEVFSKQLLDLHSSRAVRIMQDTTGLIERPCAKNTKKHLNRNHGSTKCYYPAPPPFQQTPFNCSVCVSGAIGWYPTVNSAQTYAAKTGQFSPCAVWKSSIASFYLGMDDSITQAFGLALFNDQTISCSANSTLGTGGFLIDQGPYCASLDNVNAFATILANSADIETALETAQSSYSADGATCPPNANSGTVISVTYSYATLTEVCAPDTTPSQYVDIATGCKVNNTSS